MENKQKIIDIKAIIEKESFESIIGDINHSYQIKKFTSTSSIDKKLKMQSAQIIGRCNESSKAPPRGYFSDGSNEEVREKRPYHRKKIGVRFPNRGLGLIDIEIEESWRETVFHIIINKGLEDPDVYKKAHLSKMVFSKIRNNVDYQPSKDTAIQMCIGLELSLEESVDLLSRAGFAINPHSLRDKIIAYYLAKGIYDLDDLNESLRSLNLKEFPDTHLR